MCGGRFGKWESIDFNFFQGGVLEVFKKESFFSKYIFLCFYIFGIFQYNKRGDFQDQGYWVLWIGRKFRNGYKLLFINGVILEFENF